ncbi:MAG: histidine kinase dimerization/phosphoacceptor domain -containing protein [Verrucomicrobiales bacterium]
MGEAELTQRARLAVSSVESSISKDLALEEHFAVVERCRAILNDTEELLYIVVTLRDGSALVHFGQQWTLETDGSRWTKQGGSEDVATIAQSPFEPEREVMQYRHQLTYLTLPLGNVHIGISTDSYRSNMSDLKSRTTMLALLALGFGIPASMLFSRQFSRPISDLREYAVKVASGDLQGKVAIRGTDEILQLADTMNWMTGRLSESRDQLEASLLQEASLREKDILLREIHHRVKNNMQILAALIRFQCRGTDSEEVKRVLGESESRIRSMALLHQKLYQSASISEVSLAAYAGGLVGELQRIYSSAARNVKVIVDIDEGVELGLDTALPCGLIINELVSNSLKYAFPDGQEGEIRVGLVEDPTHPELFVISVSDTGIGLSDSFDLAGAQSLGLRLVKMLTEQLCGEVTVTSDRGATFLVKLQHADYRERMECEKSNYNTTEDSKR